MSLMIIRPLAGRVADTRGHGPVVIPGIVVVAIAMVALALADSLGLFLLAGCLNGLGMGLAQPSLQAITVEGVAPQRRGAANATFFIAFDLGIGIGAMLWGVVAAQWGYPAVYAASAGAALAGLAIYMRYSSDHAQTPGALDGSKEAG
ncbi:MAG: MFS transporter [Clostridia bacterium]|nr:MFS transporter [Clostridia bacterium]